MQNSLLKRTLQLGFIFLCITLFFACSRIPKGVISEKKMRSMLVDMQIAEEMINMNPQDYGSNEEKTALYQAVFDKYRITEAEYDSSLIWYGRNLDLYMRIYNLALTDVKKRIEIMGDVKPEAISTSDEDSINIWMYRDYYEFTPFALSNTIIFDYEPSREYASGSVFILNFDVWGLWAENKQTIDVQICAIQNDTILVTKKTIRDNGNQELILKTLPTRKTKRLYGSIRLNEKTLPFYRYHKIYLDDFQLTRFNYGKEYIEKNDSIADKGLRVN